MIPLSTRMRPDNLEDFVGQEHFMYKGSLLYNAIKNKTFDSAIFFGPSGTDACHIAGRRFPGIGLQSDSPYARLRGSFAGQLGDGTGRCAGSGFCTF